ncbi:MAG TPA: alpha-glucan family phosphorylase [Planctomycetaceae bacterium]|jgi:starch phosphorylase
MATATTDENTVDSSHDAQEASLLLALEEISQLVAQTQTPAATLTKIVGLIQGRFGTDVCSVYLLTPDRLNLMLAATIGLRPECVGTLRMGLTEGLAGLVAQELKPVAVSDAFQHPRFKYFPNAGEDPYHSFLGLPLFDRGVLQGVIVVQTVDPRTFAADEMRMLTTAAGQLGPLVSTVRALEQYVAPAHDRLWTLANNLWWSWDAETVSIFRDLEPNRWRDLDHNPLALLAECSLEALSGRIAQNVLHSRIQNACHRLEDYLESNKTWGSRFAGVLRSRPVAYFSAEFGLHESIPIYSGGLGVLAGDHVKSASDLGVPLIGIGLFYNQGYFRQRLTHDDWQQEDYLSTRREMLPVEAARGPDGEQVIVSIATRSGTISARVWRITVGRCMLLLLDSDVEGNRPEDRGLTARLYGGDRRVRIRQELLLGVGGFRALRALGIHPGVIHMNEGHSAFAALEVARQRMVADGINFHEAANRVAPHSVFTTHTPVPAGHDRFSADLIEEHLGPLREELGLSYDALLGMGRVDPFNHGEEFCMTVLAIKMSRRRNAVAALHGQVSRAMWTGLYPGRMADEVPIGHITNGIHVLSWLATPMRQMFDRHLAIDWMRRTGEPDTWEPIETIDNGELWETHQTLKYELLEFVRRHLVRLGELRHEPSSVVQQYRRALSLDTLTIGFARRFATYKRANLIFRDIDRIAALVNDPRRPVQFVFAGKAHPQDEPGKQILQQIAKLSRDKRFLGKVVFVEDYDIKTGRNLVQGVDVWLNTPRRPLEASGTSGQKVVLNGGLNLSILDGWWAEAYDGTNGFAIGAGDSHTSNDVQDERDAESLYRVLEKEVVPLYYDRDPGGLPAKWLAQMKRSMRSLGWRFSADRMVMDYVQKCYLPAAGGVSSDMNLG